MNYKYEIKNMILEIWDTENPLPENLPFFRQPEWPDGTAWNDEAEIAKYAEAKISELLDPQSEFVAGSSPDSPIVPRPAPVEFDPETGLPVEPDELPLPEPDTSA